MYVAWSRRWRQRYDRGFWVTAFVYLVSMAFSTVPAPLYVLYQQRDGFSQLMITVIFAVYAVGVMVSLFLFGHLSDWFGRRKVLVCGLWLNILVGILFLVGDGIAVLLVARFVCGIAVGMITGTATAYLVELYGVARPRRTRQRSDIVSSSVPMVGLGGGALLAGLLAQYVAWPLRTPYGVSIFLLFIALLWVRAVPETVNKQKALSTYRVRKIVLPAGAKSIFFAAAFTALASFAMLAVFSSISPAFIAGVLGLTSRAIAGAVTFLVFGAGALAPLFLMQASLHRILSWGFTLMIGGLVILTAGVWLANFIVFLVGGVVVGAAAGTLFKGCISTVIGLAPPAARAGTLAGLFLMAYIGLSLPIVTLGVASLYVASTTALIGFVLVFMLVIVASRRRLLATARETE